MTAAAPTAPTSRGRIVAWGFWDWGSAAFNTVMLTFVFTVYLTDVVGGRDPSATAALGWAVGIAGFVLAVTAPVVAAKTDGAGHRKRATGVWTGATIVTIAACVAVRDDPDYLVLGLVLIALGSIFWELASVSYNAMLCQISTPATIGRISGFGWSMGYFGGIVLLLVLYLGFIAGGDDATAGLLGVSTADGWNFRLIALVAAGWFLVSAIPLFVAVPEVPATVAPEKVGTVTMVVRAYRTLVGDIRELYRTDRHAVWFLLSSAIYRDGLAGVFTFGAILAVSVYGIPRGDVLIFGIVANVVSALGALLGGVIEDRVGPKPVIIVSLVGLCVTGVVLLFVSGPSSFWVFGLVLTLFVGPAQSSSRTFVARLAPVGQEGKFFGLYATTGRAATFLAPNLFALFVWLFHADRAGIVGIVIVLLAGLLAFVKVRPPRTAGLAQSAQAQP